MLGILLAFGAIAGLIVYAGRPPADEFPDMPPEPELEPEFEPEAEGIAGEPPFMFGVPLAGLVVDFDDMLAEPPPAFELRRGDELLIRLPDLPAGTRWLFESDSPELAVGTVERSGDPSQYLQVAAFSDARATQTAVYVQQERVGTEGQRWIAAQGRVDVDVITAARPTGFAI